MRSRKAAITNMNFADLAALHRSQLGKSGNQVPWGKPISLFPTPERSGFLFNYHEVGQPDKEPTGGHTLILGRPGSGKSVLSAFLMTQARRCGARVFVFDYRLGMEMAVRANGGRYSAIKAGEVTGLNAWGLCPPCDITFAGEYKGNPAHGPFHPSSDGKYKSMKMGFRLCYQVAENGGQV